MARRVAVRAQSEVTEIGRVVRVRKNEEAILSEQSQAVCNREVDSSNQLAGKPFIAVIVFNRVNVTVYLGRSLSDTTTDVTRNFTTEWDLLEQVEHERPCLHLEIRWKRGFCVGQVSDFIAGS